MGSSSNQLVALACGVGIVILIVIERLLSHSRVESLVIYGIVACLLGFAVWEWRRPSAPQ
jgi:high-affinity Fe2+/Pb2+ permease